MKRLVLLILAVMCVEVVFGQDYSLSFIVPNDKKYANNIVVCNDMGCKFTSVDVYYGNSLLGSLTNLGRRGGKYCFRKKYYKKQATVWRSHNGVYKFHGQELRIDINSPESVDRNLVLYAVPKHHKHDFVVFIETRRKRLEESYDSLVSTIVVEENLDSLIEKGNSAYGEYDFFSASRYFEKAAIKSNDIENMYFAALSFERSNYSGDIHKACYWFEKSASQGYEDAKSSLPRIYFKTGVGYDKIEWYSTAFYFYEKSYELGYADAANNIGVMYDNGKGVSRNQYTALTWFEKAADMGSKSGRYNYNIVKSRIESTSTSTSSSSSGSIFLDLLDATAQTIGLVNDIKNGGSSTSSSSTNTGSYQSSGSYNSGSYSSSGSSNTGGSTTTSGNSSSTSTHIPSNAFCTEKLRLYQKYENRLLLMQRDPEVHYNDNDRRIIQKDMRRIRNELISSGCDKNPYKSNMEDWDGTL